MPEDKRTKLRKCVKQSEERLGEVVNQLKELCEDLSYSLDRIVYSLLNVTGKLVCIHGALEMIETLLGEEDK